MVKRFLLPFFVVCAFVMVGCGKTESNENMGAGNSNNSNKAATSTNSSSGNTGTSSTVSSSEKIGIADCDDFIAKYDACVSNKVPETARAQYKSAIAQWREGWKKAAENPATKATLAAQCKQIAEQQKNALKMYGCEF